MKKILIGIALALSLSAAGAWAQDSDASATGEDAPQAAIIRPAAKGPEKAPPICDTYPNALGITYGSDITTTSIFNLHYHRWIGDFGLALSVGCMKDALFIRGWGVDALGMLQYKVSDGNFDSEGFLYGALYAFAQAGYVAKESVTSTYNVTTDQTVTTSSFAQYVPISLGIGVEAVVFKHLSFPVELGFEYHLLDGYMGPIFMGAIRYRF